MSYVVRLLIYVHVFALRQTHYKVLCFNSIHPKFSPKYLPSYLLTHLDAEKYNGRTKSESWLLSLADSEVAWDLENSQYQLFCKSAYFYFSYSCPTFDQINCFTRLPSLNSLLTVTYRHYTLNFLGRGLCGISSLVIEGWKLKIRIIWSDWYDAHP